MKLHSLLVQYSLHPFLLLTSSFLLYILCATIYRCFALLSSVKWVQNIAIRALKCGPIPKHIAFIMDGNRRWAQKFSLPSHKGHAVGRETLAQVLQWCLKAGVETVTVYAWSLENFKRSEAEVKEIMKLALEAVEEFNRKEHFIHENRVQIRVLGDLKRLPDELRQHMVRLMRDTMQYSDGLVLNICFSYTSRHDIANSVSDLVKIVRHSNLAAEMITGTAVGACLSTGWAKGANVCMHPQLLVRTSGETRLSDFLLYECSNSVLSFYPVLWPDLCAWDFVKIILEYQHVVKRKSMKACSCMSMAAEASDLSEDMRAALTEMRCQHLDQIQMSASPPRAMSNERLKS